MSNLQPNCCLKVDFQKVDQYRRQVVNQRHQTPQGQSVAKPPPPVEYLRCDIKGSDDSMLNQIFLKKVQGQKHPRRWEIAEYKIPSVKMLLDTNTNGHKHLSICLFIIEPDTLVKPKKTTSGIQRRNRALPQNSPIDCDGMQLHQYWTTLPVYVYIRPKTKTCIKNAYLNLNIY